MTVGRKPRRPYLLRAMHQWMTDSGLTPHLMIDATLPDVEVPTAHVREGRIVLNVSYDATRHLDIGDEWVSFEARFSGVPRLLRFPAVAVQGIYARETGEGLMFPPGEDDSPPASSPPASSESAAPSDTTPESTADSPPEPPRSSPGGRGRPSLKIVK